PYACDVAGGHFFFSSRRRHTRSKRNWSSDVCSSDLEEYPLTEDAIDQLENYCLEYGIRQKRQWTQEEPWEYRRFYGMDKAKKTDKDIQFQIEINAYRNQVVQALFSFDDAIRRAETIEEKCTEIYALLEKLQIPTQLERAREAF